MEESKKMWWCGLEYYLSRIHGNEARKRHHVKVKLIDRNGAFIRYVEDISYKEDTIKVNGIDKVIDTYLEVTI